MFAKTSAEGDKKVLGLRAPLVDVVPKTAYLEPVLGLDKLIAGPDPDVLLDQFRESGVLLDDAWLIEPAVCPSNPPSIFGNVPITCCANS